MKRLMHATALATVLALPAAAGDVALVVSNAEGARLERAQIARSMDRARSALEGQGVVLSWGAGLDSEGLSDAVESFLDALAAEGDETSAAVVLTGRFAHSGTDSFLLPDDFPADGDLTDAWRTGLPLSLVLAALAEHPGEAMLVIAQAEGAPKPGAFLEAGLGDLDIPQGVTVVSGEVADVAAFTATGLTDRAADTVSVAMTRHGLEAQGFVRTGDTLFDAVAVAPAPAPVPAPRAPAISEADLWQTTRSADTVAAYEAYLAAFPDGANADTARKMIVEIESDPLRDERLAEEALSLSRDARRDIQRDLSLLGHDPRGIDGIFGPGTRAAVKSWQQANGFGDTSFLTQEQITRLDAQAERRAAELEEEARQRRIEQERQDRAFWEETGKAGDAAGLRAYLKRYPDGLFAEVAQERLDAIEAEARAQAQAQDRAAWDAAAQANSVQGYQSYLEAFPNGAFAEEARARIEAARQNDANRELLARAEAQENALGLNGTVRRLVEARLQQLDLKPGTVDGQFDEATRRALRRYQQARNLTVSGYLDQPTAVRLLAESF